MDNNDAAIKASTSNERQLKKKVVLGFSGGLDTSYCVKYLTILYA